MPHFVSMACISLRDAGSCPRIQSLSPNNTFIDCKGVAGCCKILSDIKPPPKGSRANTPAPASLYFTAQRTLAAAPLRGDPSEEDKDDSGGINVDPVRARPRLASIAPALERA